MTGNKALFKTLFEGNIGTVTFGLNGLNVLFTKYECEILDGRGDCICVGIRTANNYYGITPSISHKCYSVKINQVDLCHQ